MNDDGSHVISEAGERPRLAMLFDIANLPARWAPAILAKAQALGDVVVAHAYGDFRRTETEAWSQACVELDITPSQPFFPTAGKNSADIELVIDAMDMMHAGFVTGIAVASSDTDFAPLARRVTTAGLQFIGFGDHTAPDRLRTACSSFFLIEMLPSATLRDDGSLQAEPSARPALAAPLLKKAVAVTKDHEGWSLVEDVQDELAALHKGFDARIYGYRRLADLLAHFGHFQVEDGAGDKARVRRRPTRLSLKRRAARLANRESARQGRASETDPPGGGKAADPARAPSVDRNGELGEG